MSSDMAIVNLSRALPARKRQAPCDCGVEVQGEHLHLTAHLPENLRSVSTLQWLQAGDYLFRRGDAVDAAYQVVQGTVGLSCGLPACEAAPSLLLSAGEYLVEAGAIHGHNAIFRGKGGAALRIPLHAFHAVMLKDGSFAATFGMQMAERAQRLHRLAERRGVNIAEDRLCHFLMTESDEGCGKVSVRTYADLADELGVASETLSRVLKSMEAQGKIQRDGRTLTLTATPPGG